VPALFRPSSQLRIATIARQHEVAVVRKGRELEFLISGDYLATYWSAPDGSAAASLVASAGRSAGVQRIRSLTRP